MCMNMFANIDIINRGSNRLTIFNNMVSLR